MQQMRDGMVPLNRAASIRIYRDAHRFAWLRCTTLHKGRTMNKNITAFLRIDHPQLTDLCAVMPRNVKQSTISHLTAHFRVKGRAIENDVDLVAFFARQNCFDN